MRKVNVVPYKYMGQYMLVDIANLYAVFYHETDDRWAGDRSEYLALDDIVPSHKAILYDEMFCLTSGEPVFGWRNLTLENSVLSTYKCSSEPISWLELLINTGMHRGRAEKMLTQTLSDVLWTSEHTKRLMEGRKRSGGRT